MVLTEIQNCYEGALYYVYFVKLCSLQFSGQFCDAITAVRIGPFKNKQNAEYFHFYRATP